MHDEQKPPLRAMRTQDDPGYRVDENHSPAAFEAYLASVRARGIQKYKMTVLTAHQMGTCRMGTSPKDSVTNIDNICCMYGLIDVKMD